MIKKLYILFVVSIISFVHGNVSELSAQSTQLQTDRLCYVSGDLVFLKTITFQSDNALFNESVLYVDLVDRDSKFLAGEIFKLEKGISSGFINIPDSIKTGYYLLRAYTYNSIHSESQKILTSKQIFITNRFGNNSERFEGDINAIDGINNIELLQELPNEKCVIYLNDTLFKKRSKVSATFKLTDKLLLDKVYASISVKPLSQCELQMVQANDVLFKNGDYVENPILNDTIFYENKGMIISGRATHSTTGNPLSNLLVLLAFEDSVIRLKYCITNKLGEFKFMLTDYFDKQVIYLSAYSYPNFELYSQANFTIDSKFLDLGTGATGLETKMAVGYENSLDSVNVLKSVIAMAYGINYIETPQKTSRSDSSFEQLFLAGNFTNTVMIDDYIDLPDFIQITREILPVVRLRKNDNKYIFSVVDGKNDLIRENPVVFVDGVPLTDINAILGWGTSKIKSVQVQTEPRYFGDVGFENGIVLIWTKNMDFWSKVESKYTSIFTIPGFQKPIKLNFPDYSTLVDITQPDFRKILFWEPSIVIQNKDTMVLDFYTSDEAGVFELLLQGVSSSNKPFVIRKYIHVK